MKEFKRWIFSMMFLLILTGCAKAEEKPLKVYSFSGENEQIAVSNGVIEMCIRDRLSTADDGIVNQQQAAVSN